MSGESFREISVRSGNGIGKTTCVARLVLWFLYTDPRAVVVLTSPSANQAQDGMRLQLSARLSMSPKYIYDMYVMYSNTIRIVRDPKSTEGLKGSKLNYCVNKQASPDKAESLKGIHSRGRIMAIIDESSGVHPVVFDSLAGIRTNDDYIFLTISNPNRTEGYFYDQHREGKSVQQLKFSSLDSPNVSMNLVNKIIEDY